MKARTYVEAIHRLRSAGVDEKKIGDNLVAHLKSRGALKLLPGILTELRAYEARMRSVEATVETAKESGASTALAGAKDAGITATKAVVNPSLISGWRARAKGILVDHSGKRALLDLYRKVADA